MAPLLFLLTSDALGPLQLPTDPIGWDSLRYLFSRDAKRHGVTFSVSTDLTFIKEGAAYIRCVYEGGTDALGRVIPAHGVEGLVTLTVFEQDPNELRPVEIFRGRLDFTTYESAETGVTARFKETSFATALSTRADTAVDLLGNESLSGVALPGYTPVAPVLHSQQTLQRFDMAQVNPPVPPLSQGLVFDNGDSTDERSLLLFFGMDTTRLNEFGISPFATGPEPGDSFSPVNIPFYTATATGPHTVSLCLNTAVRVKQESGGYYRQVDIKYEFRSIIGGVVTTTPLITPFHKSAPFQQAGDGTGGNDETFSFAVAPRTFGPYNMVPGDQLYLYGEVYVHDPNTTPSSTSVTCAMGVGSYLKMSAPTTTQASVCPGLLVHEALSRCCEAATDQRDALYSEYYGRTDTRVPYSADGPGSQRLITSGFQLRGFPLPSTPAPLAGETDTRKSLSLSLNSLYDSLDAIDCVGMGLETRAGRPVVRIEPRGYFYQSTTTLELGAVTGLKKGVYTDWLYNEAQVGYTHWQSGAPNGLDEFNGLRTYALPLTQVKKTYPAVSALNAAGYLIEEARRDRYAAGSTKEGQADAEPFVICLRRTPAHTETVLGFTVYFPAGWASETTQAVVPGTVGGILSPETAYNLRLSPGRMLRAHGPWLRAGLAAQTTKRLLLSSSAGNAHLVSQRPGEAAPVDEFRDVAVAELPPPPVLAETYEFTTRLRRGHMARLQANPYGRISFLDALGTRKSGYLLRAERTPQTGLTTFTLLRAAF